MFETHRQIIMAWEHLADFAADLGISENTAKMMRQRDSIPADYWPEVVIAAEKRKISGVSTDLLAKLRAKGRKGGRRSVAA